ncbi:MAG: membrane dipeptidase [Myxococcales bacterium]|nr:dipeptidase [Polyangiaceae bacterium]MDW8250453.1 membrane dipeptidase [Myxococcales bacterium]
MRIEYTDHRSDPGGWARELGISREAVELYLQSDVIDLHIDSYIWHRIGGYDLRQRHGHGLFGARFYSQVDFPRLLEAGVTGATWVITTNPLRSREERPEVFARNLAELKELFAGVSEQFAVVRNAAEYRAAKAAGKHGAFLGVQGGNAFDRDIEALEAIPEELLRVTLVHLSTSRLGVTSSPLARVAGGDGGLTHLGRAMVEQLNAKKIFVDLAHISRKGFFDALAVHDRSQPVLVSHTGIAGVHEHWRNLTDAQVLAVAELGGTIGIMYQSSFLGDSPLGGRLASIVDHMAHVIRLVGDDHVSLGSDWDGAILPPRDLPTCLELPRIVEEMLRRGWSTERIQKVLGGNALRTIEALRG